MTPSRRPPTAAFVAVAATVLAGGGFWWLRAGPPTPAGPGESADRVVLQRTSGAVLTYAGDQGGDVSPAQLDRAIGTFWPCRPGSSADLRSERRRGLDFDRPLDNGVILLPVCTVGPALAR